MLPFTVSLRAGLPVYEQVVYAVTKAVVTGQLRPGDAFPSVRTLSQELKINPNTSYRIVARLTADGVLEVRPGIGTFISAGRPGPISGRKVLPEDEAERVVIAARRGGLSLDDLLAAIRRSWNRLVIRAGERT
jgi:DNA-binding transcriptional regulator YhcF (GntR family)